jgi:hypothetical protein
MNDNIDDILEADNVWLEERETAVVLASCSDEECLDRLLSALNISSAFVYVGYTSQLKVPQKEWDSLSVMKQDMMRQYAAGFVDGWEAANEQIDQKPLDKPISVVILNGCADKIMSGALIKSVCF